MRPNYEKLAEIMRLGLEYCDLLKTVAGPSRKLSFAREFFEANEFGLGIEFVTELSSDLSLDGASRTKLLKLSSLIGSR